MLSLAHNAVLPKATLKAIDVGQRQELAKGDRKIFTVKCMLKYEIYLLASVSLHVIS